MKNSLYILLLSALVTASACKKTKDEKKEEGNGKDRELMLTYYADSVIIPSYANFKTVFDVMKSRAESFTSAPGAASLDALRTAWADAYVQWQKVEMFDFGPAEVNTIRNFYNIYPADTVGIKANFSNTGASLEVPAAYAQQGFPALDYLINGVRSGDTSILAFYRDPSEGSKRLAYIKRITDRMDALLGAVVTGWNGQYRSDFISRTGLDVNSSTSLLVNGIVMHYERFIRSGKFGIPSGAMLNGVVSPEKVEGYYKRDISLKLAKSAHDAFVAFFNGRSFITGAEEASLKTYIDALGAKDNASGKMLSQILNEQFVVVGSKIDLLMPDFYQQILTNNAAMKDVFDNMQVATRIMKVDMSSAMSITITYTDNDGD